MNYQVQPFVNHENLQELSEFFQKSIGPKGTYKFFTTSAGQTRVCKSSYGLVTSLISEMVDPCAETVLHLVKSHLGQNLDFGLILGSLTCDLILQSQETVDFSAILVPILQKSQFSLALDDVQMMLSFLRSTLPMPGSSMNIEALITKLLEAFLTHLPNDLKDLDKFFIDFNIQSGPKDGVEIRQGFLYPIPEIESAKDLRWSKYGQKGLKIILTDFQLKQNMNELCDKPESIRFETQIAMQQYVQRLLTFCLQNQVDLIANQKVVEIDIIEAFREKGILVLPRLGTKGIQSLQRLLGSRIIASIGDLLNAGNLVKTIDDLKLELINDQTYLCLRSNSKSTHHCTLVLTQWNQEFTPELEFLIHRTQDLLFRIIANPHVLPGAGCTEAILYNSLPKEKCTYGFRKALLNIISAIFQEKSVFLELETDLEFGHLWKINEFQCQCRMLKRYQITEFLPFPHEQCLQVKAAVPLKQEKLVLDHYQSKMSMFATALEASEGLSKVGKILCI